MFNSVKTIVLLFLAVRFLGHIKANGEQYLSHARPYFMMEAPRVTNWGVWGPLELCPKGMYAVGFELRVESNIGLGDDTALNAIRLTCGNLTGQMTHPVVTVESSSERWGYWRGYRACQGLVVGFQLNVEASLGACEDDSSAGDLNIFCATKDPNKTVINGGGISFRNSRWTKPQLCPEGHAVCGLRTQVEPLQGHDPRGAKCLYNDDSALNNVDMACCYISHHQHR